MTNTTATIHAHPTDPNILVLKTPPDHANEMGRFEPARYDHGMRAYLLHIDHLEPLRKFAKRQGMYLVDQRTAPPGKKTLMPECRSCSQPASLGAQPLRCPACGEVWRPVFHDGRDTHESTTKTCVRCDHTQGRHWRYCGKCGATMPPDPPKDDKHHELNLPPRKRLEDPAPLAAVMPETRDVLSRDRARTLLDQYETVDLPNDQEES